MIMMAMLRSACWHRQDRFNAISRMSIRAVAGIDGGLACPDLAAWAHQRLRHCYHCWIRCFYCARSDLLNQLEKRIAAPLRWLFEFPSMSWRLPP
jgi:hypothetical protein